jgi:TetR/AcrR family transcriptional regulator
MTQTAFIRARTEDQIEIRRAEILQAAAELIMQDGFDKVSLNGIARRAGIAKSNLYRYFDGKEEIFFDVMAHDYGDWFDDIETRFKKLKPGVSDADVAREMSDSLRERERLCHFISVKAVVLEKNMSEETLTRFTGLLMGRAFNLVAVLITPLPPLTHKQGIFLMKATHAAIAGLWPASQLNHLDNVTDLPDIEDWRTDFHRDLEKTLFYLLKGMRSP